MHVGLEYLLYDRQFYYFFTFFNQQTAFRSLYPFVPAISVPVHLSPEVEPYTFNRSGIVHFQLKWNCLLYIRYIFIYFFAQSVCTPYMGHPQLEDIICDTKIRPTACLFVSGRTHLSCAPQPRQHGIFLRKSSQTTGSLRDDNRREQR